MPDLKYGRIFTEGDVEKILELAVQHGSDLADVLAEADEEGVRFKFDADEPVIVFRGHDKRAAGVIKFYGDHQSPRAPVNHLDGIDRAYDAFIAYRDAHPEKMREPD